MGVDSYKAKS